MKSAFFTCAFLFFMPNAQAGEPVERCFGLLSRHEEGAANQFCGRDRINELCTVLKPVDGRAIVELEWARISHRRVCVRAERDGPLSLYVSDVRDAGRQ